MFGDAIVEIGPANVPLWVVLCVVAFAGVILVEYLAFRRDRSVWRRANDLYATAIAAAVIGWKLTPVITRFSQIRSDFRTLLYMPGGTTGVVVGTTAALIVWAISIPRLVKSTALEERRKLACYAAIPAVALAVAIAASLVFSQASPPNSSSDEALPPVVADLLDGNEIALGSAASPSLLVFWATWCGPCTGQLPELQRIYDRLGDEVTIVAINLTRTESDVDVVRSYIEEHGYSFPVVIDPSGQIQREFEVSGTPTTIISDGQNTVRHRRVGAVASTWITARLLPFVE